MPTQDMWNALPQSLLSQKIRGDTPSREPHVPQMALTSLLLDIGGAMSQRAMAALRAGVM